MKGLVELVGLAHNAKKYLAHNSEHGDKTTRIIQGYSHVILKRETPYSLISNKESGSYTRA